LEVCRLRSTRLQRSSPAILRSLRWRAQRYRERPAKVRWAERLWQRARAQTRRENLLRLRWAERLWQRARAETRRENLVRLHWGERLWRGARLQTRHEDRVKACWLERLQPRARSQGLLRPMMLRASQLDPPRRRNCAGRRDLGQCWRLLRRWSPNSAVLGLLSLLCVHSPLVRGRIAVLGVAQRRQDL
jgi:hypothetical protein